MRRPPRRHVRVRDLGRARATSSGWSATGSASSRSTGSTTAAARLRLRDQGAAADPCRPARDRRGGALPLPPFLPTPAPRTLFAGISKLPPATGCWCGADGTTDERALLGPVGDRSRRSTARSTTGWPSAAPSCERSVDRRKMSDVPVGVFLSGGIDSSTNAALFSEARARRSTRSRSATTARTSTTTSSTGRGGSPSSSAPTTTRSASTRTTCRLPARAGAPPGRADRRPGLRAALLRLEARARQRRHRRAGRRGRRRAVLRLPDLRRGAADRRRALAAAARAATSRCAAPGRRGDAGARHTAPAASCTPRRYARPRQPDGELWWGGAVAFYEQGFERITTTAPAPRTQRRASRDVVAAIRADADRVRRARPTSTG